MKPAQISNPDLDQQQHAPAAEAKLEFHYGLISGIPLSRETLALIALNRIYAHRELIMFRVALKFGKEFINEAQELTHALLIIERLLMDAGINTELAHTNPDDPELRYTFLQVAEDVLQHSGEQPATWERSNLLSAVNKQFRPWIKKPKGVAAK